MSAAAGLTDLARIDQVAARLDDITDQAHARASRLGFFPAVYLQMTRAVRRGVEEGVFDDGARMSEFVARFAQRYFDALDAWQAGAPTTRSWRGAMRVTERTDRLIVQVVLLAISAHINLDLAVVTADASSRADPSDFKTDFDRINVLLGRIVDDMQNTVSRFSPLLGVLDRVGGRTEEQVLDFSFREARSEAWRQAVVLSRLPVSHRDEAVSLLDRKVAFLGRIIERPGGLAGKALEVIRSVESDDVPAIIDGLRRMSPPTLA